MSFGLPHVYHNSEGWGPPTRDAEFIGEIPYSPFNKGERYGRVADWSQNTQRFQNQRGYFTPQPGSFFSGALKDEDVSGFQCVDSQVRNLQGNRPKFSRPFMQRGRGRGDGRPIIKFVRQKIIPQKQSKLRTAYRHDFQKRQFVHRMASVEVRPSWKVVAQFVLADICKLEVIPPDAPVDVRVCGSVDWYDPTMDRICLKTPMKMEGCSSKTFHSVTTTDDPIMRELMSQEVVSVDGLPQHRVFATDTILAALMTSTRSVNSWDLQVEVIDMGNSKMVFFDKREDFDLLPVNETSREPIVSAEQAQGLAEELALVNQRFSQQVLKKDSKKQFTPVGSGPNPFAESGENVASSLYKYRKWKLDKTTTLTARCQLDCVTKGATRNEFLKLFALNEYDPKLTDWRKKLETSGGAVLATEIKNNSCTLAKYTTCAILAGADQMKFGYVARVNPQNRLDHCILQVQQYDPLYFARQNLALNSRNTWAILRTVVDACVKLAEGKYILMKDPNKQIMYMYALPPEQEEEDVPATQEDKEDDDE